MAEVNRELPGGPGHQQAFIKAEAARQLAAALQHPGATAAVRAAFSGGPAQQRAFVKAQANRPAVAPAAALGLGTASPAIGGQAVPLPARGGRSVPLAPAAQRGQDLESLAEDFGPEGPEDEGPEEGPGPELRGGLIGGRALMAVRQPGPWANRYRMPRTPMQRGGALGPQPGHGGNRIFRAGTRRARV